MGLFGGLFDKKVCVICGGEIGMLGNRKLEDGNMCKKCASRLSPWFSERRHSTTQEIMEQLAYRDMNYERLKSFVPTRIFGENERLYMDDNMQAFTVATAHRLNNENPDLVDYSAFVSVKPDIQEHRWEDHDYPRQEGQPPRYKYDYDFYVTIYVNHPYFDDIRFRLNSFSVKQIDYTECVRYVKMTEDVVEAMSGMRPDLIDYIRPYMPEPIPMMHPGGPAPYPHPAPRPMGAPTPQPRPVQLAQPRPMGAPASQPRPAQPTPQGRPMGQPAQPTRPAAQPARPAGQPVQPGRPAGQPAQPNSGFSGAGRQPGVPTGKGPGPQGHGGPGRR